MSSSPTITLPTPAEPIELDADMPRADLVTILQRLPFKLDRDRCVAQLDRAYEIFYSRLCRTADDTTVRPPRRGYNQVVAPYFLSLDAPWRGL
jgi:hypothetical protein